MLIYLDEVVIKLQLIVSSLWVQDIFWWPRGPTKYILLAQNIDNSCFNPQLRVRWYPSWPQQTQQVHDTLYLSITHGFSFLNLLLALKTKNKCVCHLNLYITAVRDHWLAQRISQVFIAGPKGQNKINNPYFNSQLKGYTGDC